MAHWTGKVVLITGASAGLGRAIAAAFAERGARIIVAARRAEALEGAAAILRSAGAEVLAVPADITVPGQVDALLARSIEHFGRLDVLVNNAGRSSRGNITDTGPEAFWELLELNFLAAVRCTKAALPHLLAARGHVVNIGSLASKTASPYLGAYSASKFPLAAYSQQLRLELGPAGLHTLLVCPGPIARNDAGERYEVAAAGLPASARLPGGGVKLRGIDPQWLSQRIVRYCELRRPELVVPGRARILFAVAQLWPGLGDWILRKMT